MITSHHLLAHAFRTYVLLKENDLTVMSDFLSVLLYCTYSEIAVYFCNGFKKTS